MRITLQTVLNVTVKNQTTSMSFGVMMRHIWLSFLGKIESIYILTFHTLALVVCW